MVIGQKHRTLDLIAENSELADAWVKGLRHLVKKLSEADLLTQQEVYPCLLKLVNSC